MLTHVDAPLHVRGESRFVDDIPLSVGTLHAAVVASPVAHGRILDLPLDEALRLPGVVRIITAADIPGENQLGKVTMDEPLLADGVVHHVGQPMALVVADSPEAARKAAAAVSARFEELPAIFDPVEAFARGSVLAPSRTVSMGNVEEAWEVCQTVVDGEVRCGAQEHVYLETQGALAMPREGGGIVVHSATQSSSIVQMLTARVLGCPMHRVEVHVPRLGGGFGGKEDQATHWAAMASVAACLTNRPVKLVLKRNEDMRFTGKRHPYVARFKMGLNGEGKILAYEVSFYQNAGATTDLSPAILERSIFHATNAYFIPHVKITAVSCKTNLPSNTAFRGFGGPQAMFVLECAIERAAEALQVSPQDIQKRNILGEGDSFWYGMRAERCHMGPCLSVAEEKYDFVGMARRVEEHNRSHRWSKKGLSLMPVCFGISFTSTFLNQADALVHVYSDGSVGVSTSAVEMGQGVSTKVRDVTARTLSIDPGLIRVEPSDTSRVANTSPTAASTGADLNGHAVRLACLEILGRLKGLASRMPGFHVDDDFEIRHGLLWRNGEETEISWRNIISLAYFNRIGLSAQGHYATPDIYFDRERWRGKPFAYHTYGVAITEVTVDCLRGTYRVDAVKVVHDTGKSLNPLVDLGQIEGGIVQGIGWMTIEEILHDDRGRLLNDSLARYKIPDVHFAPREISTHFLEGSDNPAGPLGSKTVGEPPFMYGIGTYFAIRQAMKAFLPGKQLPFPAPLTPERVLCSLYPEDFARMHDG